MSSDDSCYSNKPIKTNKKNKIQNINKIHNSKTANKNDKTNVPTIQGMTKIINKQMTENFSNKFAFDHKRSEVINFKDNIKTNQTFGNISKLGSQLIKPSNTKVFGGNISKLELDDKYRKVIRNDTIVGNTVKN
jgi:hypothetical protein